MSFSNYLEQKLAEHSLGIASYSMPSNIYAALFSSPLSDTSDFSNELSGGGYARVNITGQLAYTGGVIQNTVVLQFPAATSDWGTVAGIAIVNADAGGDILYWGNFDPTRTVSTGDVFAFLAGTFKIILD